MKSALNSLSESLKKREENNSLRNLDIVKGLIDFSSNDYLGLNTNSELMQSIHTASSSEDSIGSGGSRLLSGNSELAESTEEYLAEFFEAESALVFSSGYSANLGVLQSIPQKGDTIIHDEHIHASLKEGARLSFANRFSFQHNDLNDLEKKLEKATGNIFIVTESVFSMHGDLCPLNEIVELAGKYDAAVILDEAHSTGIIGQEGKGLAVELNCQDSIFARIHTFGKGPGVHGAAVVGSNLLRQYLINFARSFIYTTAPPSTSLIAIREAVTFFSENTLLRDELWSNVRLFTEMMEEGNSESPIQMIQIGDVNRTKKLANELRKEGFDVRAILSPTVKQGEERLRICIHNFNTKDEIKKLVGIIKS